MSEGIVSDEMLDRFEAFARVLDFDGRRRWEAHFFRIIQDAGSPEEALLVKGIFRYVERQEREKAN